VTLSRRNLLALGLPALAGCAAGRILPSTAAPDQLLVNGRIVTMDPRRPRAEAVALRDGKFLAVGSTAEIRELGGSSAAVTDLQGKTVLPGLIDAHIHGVSSGRINLYSVDCAVTTFAELKERIRRRAREVPAGGWITGDKYDDTKFDLGRPILRGDLDEITRDHAVVITHVGGHDSFVNSRALELARITEDTPDPDGGRIERTAGGRAPSGILREKAMDLVLKLLPPMSRDENRKAAVWQLREFAKAGLTAIHDADATIEDVRGYMDAAQAGELPIRVYLMVQFAEIEKLHLWGLRTGFGNEMLRIGGTKLYTDGAIAGRTARLSRPYVGRPRDFGILTVSQEELDRRVLLAHREGWQIGVHANGDVAIEMVLSSYEKAIRAHPNADPRFRIEHCTLVSPDILRRMKALGAIPTPFCTYVYQHCEKWPAYGEERLDWMFAMRSFLDAGIPATGSSDYIPGPFPPLLGMQSCVTRKGKDGKVWGARQKITVDEAIRCYTRHSAYASFDEHRLGSIEPGKLADLVVLGADPAAVDPDALSTIPVEGTMVGGRWVWRKS
jgi:predicted amidohydrolase YtcJ